MKKVDKILMVFLIVVTCVSFAYSFYETVIKADFDVVNIEPPIGSL